MITSSATPAIIEPRAVAITTSTAMAATGPCVHVVLFPFMAQGHVAPFRCLAELVRRARPDARITMVATTPAFIRKQIAAFRRTDALLVNTAEHMKPMGLAMLRQLFNNVPVYPVGPLLRRATPAKRGGGGGGSILAWLDKQPPGSVLYVSFGSQYTIGAPQMMALAAGLQRSGHRFVWVIRSPAAGSSSDADAGNGGGSEVRPEWLPEGFRERVEGSGQGLVARCWAPQVEVLAHAATGAFLTHCGWNSAQEGLAAGVPLLGWPLSAEQFYNAKVLAEEMGVCVEVARWMRAVLSSEELAAAVETVLGDTVERAEMRRRAAEMKEVIATARGSGGDGSSVEVMERFFTDVMHC